MTIRDAIEDELFPNNYGVCGGCCACGTCHVYIKPSDFEKLTTKADEEVMPLETLDIESNQYSRLSCQVEFKKEYDDITGFMAMEKWTGWHAAIIMEKITEGESVNN